MARKNDYTMWIDQTIGKKIRDLRKDKGISGNELAELIDVSGQQLQKYEKGTNRVSVGRLILIANALNTNVAHFYQGVENNNPTPKLTNQQQMCIEVSKNFIKIHNAKHQNAVNILIKSLMKESA